MANSLFKYPEPDPRLNMGWKGLLAFLGPGFILASATVGSGEVFFAPRGGALFGYAVLWCLLAGALSKGFMAISGTRYVVLTGEHPMTRWGQIFPGPKNWFPIMMGILTIICFPSWVGGLSNLLGDVTTKWTGVLDIKWWATIYILGTLVVAVIGSYNWVEKAQTTIVVTMVVAFLVGVFAARPDWIQAFLGIFPTIPSGYEPWVIEKYPDVANRKLWVELVGYVGAIGGGTYDYIGYVGLYRNKGWGALGLPNLAEIQEKLLAADPNAKFALPVEEEELNKARAWLKAPATDVVVSFGALLVITAAVTILGATLLHPRQLVPAGTQLMEHQALFLTQLHPSLLYLYYLGIWCALWGTLYSVFELYPATTYESFAPAFKVIREAGKDGIAKWVWAYMVLAGLAYNWLGLTFTTMVTYATMIGGSLTCGIWCLAQVWTERKVLPKEYHMGPVLTACVILSGLFLLGMAAISIMQQFGIIK